MTDISVPLGVQAYNRTYGQEPEIKLENRFFETNPANQVEQNSLLARPGNTFFLGIGTAPARILAHQPGVHNGDLFIVSANLLYRYDGTTITPITGAVQGTNRPSITFVSGPGYDHLFITDGVTLQYYDGEAAANGTLTVAGGNIVAADTVTLDTVFYEWTAGSVDAGAPDGSASDPFLVDLGASDTEALANLLAAVNASGTPGTTYSTVITNEHTTVEATGSDATTMDVRARARGTPGNTIATTETGANISFGAVTLEGGGAQALNGVITPDDVAMTSLSNLASFVIAVVATSQRFYWIQPGAVIIDALDFAEAESEPDEVIEVVRIGDALWFFGQSSTEVWYASGAQDAPFLRQQGLAFSQGALEGTTALIRTQAVVVAQDGIVYEVVGGPKRVSNNGIEEKIRLALKAEMEGS